MKVLVTGPMSSGTRLLTRLIPVSDVIEVEFDTSHGIELRDCDVVLCIVRDVTATNASFTFHDQQGEYPATGPLCGGWPTRQQSLAAIVDHYPDALWVTYEQLCADPQATVAYLADRLGLEPWPIPELIESRN